MICWLNGAWVDVEGARIDPRDRGLLLGDGIFETMLAENGGIRRLPRHLARLRAAAALIAIPIPHADEEIKAAMQRLLAENQLANGRAALRLTLTRGPGARGVAPPPHPAPTVLITAAAALPPPDQVRAIVSSQIRNEKSVSTRIKSLNYLDNVLARREASLRGADEALMCNSSGGLASASSANLFTVRGGKLFTPPPEEGALPGIMRAVVIEAARDLNIPLREARIEIASLAMAEEIFLTNALTGVCPVAEMDGRAIDPGPVTQLLRLHTARMD